MKKFDSLKTFLTESKYNIRMHYVYIIVENGEAYTEAFEMYDQAVQAVKIKNKEILDWMEEECKKEELPSPYIDIDVVESSSGTTLLYIEKGINIYIHKLPVITTS